MLRTILENSVAVGVAGALLVLLASQARGDGGAPADSSQSGAMIKLKPLAIHDPQINNVAAVTLLMPESWKSSIQVAWTWDPFNRVSLAGYMLDENGLAGMGLYGRLPFSVPNGLFREGGPAYLGKTILRRLSPDQYVRQWLIPKTRPELAQAKVVSDGPSPEYAKLLTADYTALFGPGPQVSAVKIRFEYPVNGKTMEEDFYGAVTSSPAAPNNWNGDGISFRAEKGKLDQDMGLFLAMMGSMTINPNWYIQVQGLNAQLIQNYANQSNNALALSQHLAQNQAQISDMLQKSYNQRSAVLAETAHGFSQATLGLDDYKTGTDATVELPNGWDHYFTNGDGEVLLTRGVPNNQIPPGWQEMQTAR
jgi:hypothetical protein